ncbi:hypothetical protein OROMI_023331 [Orobanche minor]
MKITVERTGARQAQPPVNPPPPSDLAENPSFPRKPPRRRSKTGGAGVRLKRECGAASAKRSSRPETPSLRWKFDEGSGMNNFVEEIKSSDEAGRKCKRRIRSVVSARKLAAGLWRLRLPEFQTNVGQRLGLQQPGVDRFVADKHCHHVDRVHSPKPVPDPKHGILYKLEPSFQFPNSAMEGATKWDPHGWRTSNETNQISDQPKSLEHRANSGTVISSLESELVRARARIDELELERKSSKKKLEQFLRKLSEERAAWRSREHEKVRAIIDDMKSDLSREKKNRQRIEIVNSKLVNELADAKVSAKRFMQEYEKERKTRELIEEVCDELAKEIGEDKAEVEGLKRESMRFREEVEEERKMLQMAEVWREERVQMKLLDAKVMLEEKYSQMNTLAANLESFLSSGSVPLDSEKIKKAEFLMQVAKSVNMQDIRELTYEPPKLDDIFSVFEDVNFNESNEREVGPCEVYSPASHASKIHTVSPEVKMLNEDGPHRRRSNVYADRSGELEEDASEWETVSHPEDHVSSYSPGGSDPSVDKNLRVSNVTKTGVEWEKDEEPVMEIGEVDLVKMRQMKRASSISKLWRSCPSNGDDYRIVSLDGKNGRLSNGRISNGAIILPDRGLSPQDLPGQWSSPDSSNPHINRAMRGGCIEWARSAQKNSLKARLLEARMESRKIQLRQVLKQKI